MDGLVRRPLNAAMANSPVLVDVQLRKISGSSDTILYHPGYSVCLYVLAGAWPYSRYTWTRGSIGRNRSSTIAGHLFLSGHYDHTRLWRYARSTGKCAGSSTINGPGPPRLRHACGASVSAGGAVPGGVRPSWWVRNRHWVTLGAGILIDGLLGR